MRVVSGRGTARSSTRNVPPASPASAAQSSPGRSARCSPCGGVVAQLSAWPGKRSRNAQLAPCRQHSRHVARGRSLRRCVHLRLAARARAARHVSSGVRGGPRKSGKSKARHVRAATRASSPRAHAPSEAASPARTLGPRAAAPAWGTSSAPLSSASRACAHAQHATSQRLSRAHLYRAPPHRCASTSPGDASAATTMSPSGIQLRAQLGVSTHSRKA